MLAHALVQHTERILSDGKPASLPEPPAQVIPGLSQPPDAADSAPPSSPEPTKAMVSQVFDALIAALTAQLDAHVDSHRKAIQALQPESKLSGAGQEPEQAGKTTEDDSDDDDDTAKPQELSRRAKEVVDRKTTETDVAYVKGSTRLRNDLSVVWIKYMQAVRRVEGLRPMRAIFSRARKSPYATWRVYEASALTEYHTSKETRVAVNVFELACKLFASPAILALTPGEPSVASAQGAASSPAAPSIGGAAAMLAAQEAAAALAVRYLEFLLSINDENNARVLFERIVSSPLSPELTKPLWDRWREFTHQYGDGAAIAALDLRFLATYPNISPLEALSEAAVWADVAPIHHRDLGHPTVEEEEFQRIRAVSATTSAAAAAASVAAAPVEPAATATQPSVASEPQAAPRARSRSPTVVTPGKRTGEEMPVPSFPKRSRLNSPPPAMRERERERERERALGQYGQEAVNLPPSVWELLSKIVPAASWDGPIVQADQLLRELRSATMPPAGSRAGPGFAASHAVPASYGEPPALATRPPWLRGVSRPRKY